MKPFERSNRNIWQRLFFLTLGWVCLIVGAIGGLIPIFQGWPFGIAGLLILSREYEWAHNLVHRLRNRFPKFARVMDSTSDKAQRIIQKIIGRQAA